jgi:hypothetical protein
VSAAHLPEQWIVRVGHDRQAAKSTALRLPVRILVATRSGKLPAVIVLRSCGIAPEAPSRR